MLVNGAGPQVAAARHGNLPGPEPPQQRPQEIVAGAHLAGQLVGDFGAVDMGRVDLVGVFADHPDAGAQLAEDLERGHHIADTGKIFNQAFVRRQDRGWQNGHRRVFGAADDHIAGKSFAAANYKLFQVVTLL